MNSQKHDNSILFKRRSIRKFSDLTPEPDDVDFIVRAFFQTPSAKNQQPGEIIVVSDKQVIKALSLHHNSGAIIAQAPLLLALTSRVAYQDHPTRYYLDQDLGAASLQVLLAIEERGLGGLWCGVNDTNRSSLQEVLMIPSDVRLVSLILVGHKAETKEPNDRYEEARIHYDHW